MNTAPFLDLFANRSTGFEIVKALHRACLPTDGSAYVWAAPETVTGERRSPFRPLRRNSYTTGGGYVPAFTVGELFGLLEGTRIMIKPVPGPCATVHTGVFVAAGSEAWGYVGGFERLVDGLAAAFLLRCQFPELHKAPFEPWPREIGEAEEEPDDDYNPNDFRGLV